MDYYVAFSDVEPPFPLIDPWVSLLVSPTVISPLYRFPEKPPLKVMLDSGAFHHNQRRRGRTAAEALEHQLQLLSRMSTHGSVVQLLHCDVMPREHIPAAEALRQTLHNAEWFWQQPLAEGVQKVAVAHGQTPEQLYLVVRHFRELGYQSVAVGGLSKANVYDRKRVKAMVEAAGEAAGGIALHALGLSGPILATLLQQNGFSSCDSATPIIMAVNGSVLYSEPFVRFRVQGSLVNRVGVKQRTNLYSVIEEPKPCTCPVCQEDPWRLFQTGAPGKWYRSIHNYFHMKALMEGAHIWQRPYSSDVSRFGSTNYRSCIASSKKPQG